jgi:ABC-type dipeptide/oligopeptide/nickel transport system permease component
MRVFLRLFISVVLVFLSVLILGSLPELLAIRQGHIILNLRDPATSLSDYFSSLVSGNALEYAAGDRILSLAETFPGYFMTSLFYTASASFLALVLGLIFGLSAARKRRKWTSELLIYLGNIPDFVLIFVLQLAVIGITGATGVRVARVASSGTNSAVLLPLIAMTFFPLVYIMQIVIQSLNRLRGEYYILNVKARGFTDRHIFFRHILPGVLVNLQEDLPKILGFSVANLFITERLFNITGITRLLFTYGFMSQGFNRLAGYQYGLVVNCLFALIVLFFLTYGSFRLLLGGIIRAVCHE